MGRKKKILVIGGGAAGLMAAGRAAERGHEVHLYEKNNRLGKKLLITGKGSGRVNFSSIFLWLSPELVFLIWYSAFWAFLVTRLSGRKV